MDEYIVQAYPGYTPMTKAQLDDALRDLGATDATMQQYLDAFNRQTEARMGPNSVGLLVVGVSLFA